MPVALLTGASRGLGFALARSLVGDGWSVVIDARSAPDLDAAADALRAAASAGAVVVTVPGDVADAAHRDDLIAAVRRLGRLDLLVNNASVLGPSPQPPLLTYPLDVFEDVHRVNVVAPLALAQLAIPLLPREGGVIVNITSDAAVEAYAGWGGYGSSKAALEQVTNVLAVEHPDLRVYAVDPGDLRTQLHQDVFPGEDISDRPLPEVAVPGFRAVIEGRLPSGRYRAQELAPAEAAS